MDDSYEGLKGHFDLTTQAWLQHARGGKYLEWGWDFPGEEGGQVPKSEGVGQVLGFCCPPGINLSPPLPTALSSQGPLSPSRDLSPISSPHVVQTEPGLHCVPDGTYGQL